MTVKPTLKEAVKEAIAASGMSMKTLAERVNVDYPNLRNQISNNRFLVDQILRIAPLLGLPATLQTLREKYSFDLTKRKKHHLESTAQHAFQISTTQVIDLYRKKLLQRSDAAEAIMQAVDQLLSSKKILDK